MRAPRSWALLMLLPLGGDFQSSRSPTGFIEVGMEWNFKDEHTAWGELEDEGFCSARLDLRKGGSVRAEHSYQRTVTRKSWLNDPRRHIQTISVTISMSSLRDPSDSIPVPAPSVYEYQANPSLVRHPDGTYSLSLRRQTNLIRTVEKQHRWRREYLGVKAKELDDTPESGRVKYETCDPIDALYRALLAPSDPLARNRKLGPLSGLRDTVTVAGVYGKTIPATIHARWELRP